MARYIDVATIHFSKEEAGGVPDAARNVFDQFRRACNRLDGTGVDLIRNRFPGGTGMVRATCPRSGRDRDSALQDTCTPVLRES